MDTTLIIGTVGMVILLIGFIGNLTKKIHKNLYIVLNMLGGTLLGVYAYALRSYPFLILEIIWTGFAGWELFVKNK